MSQDQPVKMYLSRSDVKQIDALAHNKAYEEMKLRKYRHGIPTDDLLARKREIASEMARALVAMRNA